MSLGVVLVSLCLQQLKMSALFLFFTLEVVCRCWQLFYPSSQCLCVVSLRRHTEWIHTREEDGAVDREGKHKNCLPVAALCADDVRVNEENTRNRKYTGGVYMYI